MSRLSTYHAKRDLERTPEPGGSGKKAKGTKRLIFVVQRHKATRLHYDMRLEMEGVLKSWAVPKGPSLNPKDRRLAMMVEDHPYDYKDFSGVIPKGNYGAGIVEIWDKGTYVPVDSEGKPIDEKQALKDLKNGSIKFRLHGSKLKGEFALVRMKTKDADNAWLMIKHRDEAAVDDPYDSEEHTPADSPINKALRKAEGGRSQSGSTKPRSKKTAAKRSKSAARKAFGDPIKPMLAKLHDAPFDDKEWLFEVKWDGYRAIAECRGGEVRLYSRNGLSFNAKFPEVVQELEKLDHDLVLDGEVVALNKDGTPDFQALQNAQGRSAHIVFYVFDLLHADGEQIAELPLIERKERLRKLVADGTHIRYSDHVIGDGKGFFAVAAEKDLEGIIAKRIDSTYGPGKRTGAWLKIKHHQGQEAIIGGYTAPRGSRSHFGSLLLGVMDEGKLRYVGHTGTGFTENTLADLMERMKPLERKTSPFSNRIKTNQPAKWLRPELVCNLKYTELTKDGIMRHPVFLGLRSDKSADEVELETPRAARSKKALKRSAKRKAKKSSRKKTEKGSDRPDEQILKIGKKEVKLTNQNKIYWPGEGYTKGDLIDYYNAMHKFVLPYLKDRPQSLKRNPGGITDKGFYQKDVTEGTPSWLHTEPLASKSRSAPINYIICNDRATLLYMANLGCIEINPWSSKYTKPDHPDHIVIDLDPGEKTTFDQAIEAALAVKVICDEIGAPAFVKTSGASGIHIYLPTNAKYTYDELAPLSEAIAVRTRDLLPRTTTVERSIAKRGGKLYVDYLQNRRGQTLASAYSVRPVEGATVSTPLEWKELRFGLDRSDFTMHTVPKRVEQRGDPFSGVRGKGLDLAQCLKRIEAL